ncbi:MAG: hypothetical protein JW718_04700 [Desulfovibrionaceae bacterium]|nr:hypothetical protein [Desulfovibrionaceae bacterium]
MEKETLDMRDTVCGLVPAMAGRLKDTPAGVVEFLIRPGVEHELVSAFANDPDWSMALEPGEGFDRARFTRRRKARPNPLNLLSY